MYTLAAQGRRCQLGITDRSIRINFRRFLVYLYQTTEKRAEESSGNDRLYGSWRQRIDNERDSTGLLSILTILM